MPVIIFEVYRYNPEKDDSGYFKKYALEVDEKTTIIQVLRKIKDKADGSLAFRKGCGSAICGICAMRINGKPRLACKTRLSKILGDVDEASQDREEVRIEPLDNSKVIKDLVIDEQVFWDQLAKTMPWVNGNKSGGELYDMSQEEVEAVGNAHDCIHCHACTSACDSYTVDEKFLGPEALTKLYRFVKDVRDEIPFQRLQIAENGGMWNCVRAYTCVDNCPKHIDPSDKIAELHELAMDAGLDKGKGPRHAKHFVHSLKKTGKLDEKMMPIKTLGVGIVGFVPDTIRMVSKGKMPTIFNKKIEDHKEVWNLIQLAEDKKEDEKEGGK